MCLGVPAQLLEIYHLDDDPLFRTGLVDFGRLQREISLACVPEAKVGCHLLVHAGTAITVMDAKDAEKTLALLKQTVSDN